MFKPWGEVVEQTFNANPFAGMCGRLFVQKTRSMPKLPRFLGRCKVQEELKSINAAVTHHARQSNPMIKKVIHHNIEQPSDNV